MCGSAAEAKQQSNGRSPSTIQKAQHNQQLKITNSPWTNIKGDENKLWELEIHKQTYCGNIFDNCLNGLNPNMNVQQCNKFKTQSKRKTAQLSGLACDVYPVGHAKASRLQSIEVTPHTHLCLIVARQKSASGLNSRTTIMHFWSTGVPGPCPLLLATKGCR